MSRVDPTVNMAADAGEHFSAAAYGSLHDGTRDPQAALRASHVDSIARDINRHAAVVLRGAPEGLAGLEAAPSGADAGADNTPQHANTGKIAAALAAQQKAAAKAAAAGGGSSGDEALSADRMEEWQQRAASALDDLRLDDPESRYLPLNIQDPRAYFDAAAAAGMAGSGEAGGGAGGRTAAAADLRRALAAVRPAALPSPPCDPQLAGAVLLELSQDQDASLVEEFGPVAASALQYPPQDRARGLPPVLLVGLGKGWWEGMRRDCALRHARAGHTQRRLRGDALAPSPRSMQTFHSSPPPSPPTQEHLRGEALKTNELLRHFWGCVPLTSAARAARAAKLGRALQEQRKLLQGHLQHPLGEGEVHGCACARRGRFGGADAVPFDLHVPRQAALWQRSRCLLLRPLPPAPACLPPPAPYCSPACWLPPIPSSARDATPAGSGLSHATSPLSNCVHPPVYLAFRRLLPPSSRGDDAAPACGGGGRSAGAARHRAAAAAQAGAAVRGSWLAGWAGVCACPAASQQLPACLPVPAHPRLYMQLRCY